MKNLLKIYLGLSVSVMGFTLLKLEYPQYETVCQVGLFVSVAVMAYATYKYLKD